MDYYHTIHSLTAALDQLRVVVSSTSNDLPSSMSRTVAWSADVYDVMAVGDVYECVTSWNHDDRTFVVARQQQHHHVQSDHDASLICLVRQLNCISVVKYTKARFPLPELTVRVNGPS